jgi:hypothetical protein
MVTILRTSLAKRLRNISRKAKVNIMTKPAGYTLKPIGAREGGTWDEVAWLDLATSEQHDVCINRNPFGGSPTRIALDRPGFALLVTSFFCGSPCMPALYVLPDDLGAVLGLDSEMPGAPAGILADHLDEIDHRMAGTFRRAITVAQQGVAR